jgi:glutaredoxin
MQVEIYSKDNCSFCTSAKNLLNRRRIPYKEYVLGEDFDREKLLDKFPEARTFPVVVVDGIRIGGYDDLVEYVKEYDGREFLTE